MIATSSSYYEVLGVGPSADTETVRKAYRRLARKHHPDVSSDPNAHENMARINAAFETLIDPLRRQEYDAMLRGAAPDEVEESRRRAAPKPVVVRLLSRLKAHYTPVYAVSFAPDTGQLISSAFDNEIIWWADDGRPQRRTKVESGVISTLRAFSQDRIVAAGSAESQVSLWRLHGPKVESWRSSNEEWVTCLAISNDGDSLAVGSIHQALAVSNTANGSLTHRRKEHEQSVTAVAWSADGKLIASGSADATVKIVSARTGEVLHTIKQVRSTVTAIAFSPDNKYLAVAAVDLSIRVFRLSDLQIEKMMFGHTKPIETLAFHPNGWLFASGSRDGTVGLWTATKGIGNVRIEVSHRPVSCLAFSQDGTRLAAGGQDKTVRLWEVVAKHPDVD